MGFQATVSYGQLSNQIHSLIESVDSIELFNFIKSGQKLESANFHFEIVVTVIISLFENQ